MYYFAFLLLWSISSSTVCIAFTRDGLSFVSKRRQQQQHHHATTTEKLLSSKTQLQMSTSDNAPLILYGHQGSRSPLVNWGCYELGINFRMASDLRQNPHPFGQIPCLTDGDATIFESGAILQYLQYKSTIKVTDAELAAIISWITWANASLDPICFLETPNGKVYDTGLRNPNNKRLKQLDAILSKQQYLVATAGFTLADVAVASYLLYVLMFFPQVLDEQLVQAYPNIVRYMKDCVSRPNYAKAFGQAEQQNLLAGLSEAVATI